MANLNIFDVLRQLVDINNKGFEGSLAGLTTFITNYLSYAKISSSFLFKTTAQ